LCMRCAHLACWERRSIVGILALMTRHCHEFGCIELQRYLNARSLSYTAQAESGMHLGGAK
jgi:hypothetical protein